MTAPITSHRRRGRGPCRAYGDGRASSLSLYSTTSCSRQRSCDDVDAARRRSRRYRRRYSRFRCHYPPGLC